MDEATRRAASHDAAEQYATDYAGVFSPVSAIECACGYSHARGTICPCCNGMGKEAFQ